MRPIYPLLFIMSLMLGALTVPSCHPKPDAPPVINTIADCSKQEVKDHASEIEQQAIACLLGGSFQACLAGLVNPGVGITLDVIDCVVAQLYGEASADLAVEALGSGNTGVSDAQTIRDNAKSYLDSRKVGFSNPPPKLVRPKTAQRN